MNRGYTCRVVTRASTFQMMLLTLAAPRDAVEGLGALTAVGP